MSLVGIFTKWLKSIVFSSFGFFLSECLWFIPSWGYFPLMACMTLSGVNFPRSSLFENRSGSSMCASLFSWISCSDPEVKNSSWLATVSFWKCSCCSISWAFYSLLNYWTKGETYFGCSASPIITSFVGGVFSLSVTTLCDEETRSCSLVCSITISTSFSPLESLVSLVVLT